MTCVTIIKKIEEKMGPFCSLCKELFILRNIIYFYIFWFFLLDTLFIVYCFITFILNELKWFTFFLIFLDFVFQSKRDRYFRIYIIRIFFWLEKYLFVTLGWLNLVDRVFCHVFHFLIIWMSHWFTDIHKVFNGLYTPFFKGAFFQSALLSEAKASVVASKAPITLCPPLLKWTLQIDDCTPYYNNKKWRLSL